MANTPLTGNTISSSYQGLLKTGDSSALGATEKPVVDGLANASTMTMGTGGVSFTSGTVDFTGATVTGLPAGAAGLESGTGADSMQSAASLTTNPADAARDKSIALGDNASTGPDGTEQVAIGSNAKTFHDESVSIGSSATSHYFGVAIGRQADAGTSSNKGGNIAIGNVSRADGFDGTIAIGTTATALLEDSVALGQAVTAGYTGTVSVKALETQTNSTPTAGGIIMSDAGGTDRRINIDATGNLQIDSTPVGGGGATPGMLDLVLPPKRGSAFGDPGNKWMANITTDGYGITAQTKNLDNTTANISVFPMREGQTISAIKFKVQTAAASGNLKVGIYNLTTDTNGYLVLGTLEQDCGTVTFNTAGIKNITLGTPYTMPSGETYGAVAIVIGGDAADTGALGGWTQGIFTGNAVHFTNSTNDTAYRDISWFLTSWDGTFKDYSTGTYFSQTSAATFIFTQP